MTIDLPRRARAEMARPATARHIVDRLMAEAFAAELSPRLAKSALNWKYPDWRIFPSNRGRWWAFTDSASRRDYAGVLWTGLPDAVDADSPRELVAKLRARSA